jgi:hypothetical protein
MGWRYTGDNAWIHSWQLKEKKLIIVYGKEGVYNPNLAGRYLVEFLNGKSGVKVLFKSKKKGDLFARQSEAIRFAQNWMIKHPKG